MEALGPLREVRSWEALAERDSEAELRDAILATVGKRGFAKATVREMAERAGIAEASLYHRHGAKDACFAWAYEATIERAAEQVVEVFRSAPSWRAGFEAALAHLLRRVAAEPTTAKAVLVEVRAARGSAWAKHQELTERIVAALDSVGDEPGARASATATTAGFVLGAIEESLCIEIAAGRGADVERLLPDLTRLAFLQLFGEAD
ncbi:MAG TPA: helix-turn-helix domain-containing protein [Solirubrobacterales bacterium]|nr:helix-turn-helix domain-containing protein [Solirubrobacterales bacterium]